MEEIHQADQQIDLVDDEDQESGQIIWKYFKSFGIQSKKGGVKNVTCMFCDSQMSGCGSSRAYAHLLGRPVLGQSKMGVKACHPLRNSRDNRYVMFKSAQRLLEIEMKVKEDKLRSSAAKQKVLDFTTKKTKSQSPLYSCGSKRC